MFITWNASPDNYVDMKKYVFGVLSIFGSTYLCDQVFSSLNHTKSKYRSCLTDESLQACVEIRDTSYSPDIEKICSDVQKQKSHYTGENSILIRLLFYNTLSLLESCDFSQWSVWPWADIVVLLCFVYFQCRLLFIVSHLGYSFSLHKHRDDSN